MLRDSSCGNYIARPDDGLFNEVPEDGNKLVSRYPDFRIGKIVTWKQNMKLDAVILPMIALSVTP